MAAQDGVVSAEALVGVEAVVGAAVEADRADRKAAAEERSSRSFPVM